MTKRLNSEEDAKALEELGPSGGGMVEYRDSDTVLRVDKRNIEYTREGERFLEIVIKPPQVTGQERRRAECAAEGAAWGDITNPLKGAAWGEISEARARFDRAAQAEIARSLMAVHPDHDHLPEV